MLIPRDAMVVQPVTTRPDLFVNKMFRKKRCKVSSGGLKSAEIRLNVQSSESTHLEDGTRVTPVRFNFAVDISRNGVS